MKILLKGHVVTAILAWLLALYASIVNLSEGGLAAVGALFIIGVFTILTIIDLFSVYFAKRKKILVLPIISIIFWGLIFLPFGNALFSPNIPWKAKMVMSIIGLFALFKIVTSFVIIKTKKETL